MAYTLLSWRRRAYTPSPSRLPGALVLPSTVVMYRPSQPVTKPVWPTRPSELYQSVKTSPGMGVRIALRGDQILAETPENAGLQPVAGLRTPQPDR